MTSVDVLCDKGWTPALASRGAWALLVAVVGGSAGVVTAEAGPLSRPGGRTMPCYPLQWLHRVARGWTLQAQLGQHSPVHDSALQAQMTAAAPGQRHSAAVRAFTLLTWPAPVSCVLAPAGRGAGSMPLTRSPAGLQALLPCCLTRTCLYGYPPAVRVPV